MIKLSVVFIAIYFPLLVCAQKSEFLDFERIEQRKVIKLLKKNEVFSNKDFKKLKEVCSTQGDESFYRHVTSTVIEKSIDEVWQAYKTSPPQSSWVGKIASFGVMHDEEDTPIIYADAIENSMKPGQIFLVQLRLFGGLCRLAVANKVMYVDDEKHEFKICYLSSGASEGSQYIRLKETKEGFTEVTHDSFFKSKSKFRDTKLYPKIHEKIIKEYHANVAASIK